jgi:transcriptional regulator with XRE-family HTH domain
MRHRVRAVREQRRWSLTDASTASELDRTTIHRIERCVVRGRRATIIALAHGYGVSSRYLWQLHQADLADKVLADHDAREESA